MTQYKLASRWFHKTFFRWISSLWIPVTKPFTADNTRDLNAVLHHCQWSHVETFLQDFSQQFWSVSSILIVVDGSWAKNRIECVITVYVNSYIWMLTIYMDAYNLHSCLRNVGTFLQDSIDILKRIHEQTIVIQTLRT